MYSHFISQGPPVRARGRGVCRRHVSTAVWQLAAAFISWLVWFIPSSNSYVSVCELYARGSSLFFREPRHVYGRCCKRPAMHEHAQKKAVLRCNVQHTNAAINKNAFNAKPDIITTICMHGCGRIANSSCAHSPQIIWYERVKRQKKKDLLECTRCTHVIRTACSRHHFVSPSMENK